MIFEYTILPSFWYWINDREKFLRMKIYFFIGKIQHENNFVFYTYNFFYFIGFYGSGYLYGARK